MDGYSGAIAREYVLVGAYSLLFDGSIINGPPIYKVALKARKRGLPLYCVCETTKVNALNYLGKNVQLKEGFEVVPPYLIIG